MDTLQHATHCKLCTLPVFYFHQCHHVSTRTLLQSRLLRFSTDVDDFWPKPRSVNKRSPYPRLLIWW